MKYSITHPLLKRGHAGMCSQQEENEREALRQSAKTHESLLKMWINGSGAIINLLLPL